MARTTIKKPTFSSGDCLPPVDHKVDIRGFVYLTHIVWDRDESRSSSRYECVPLTSYLLPTRAGINWPSTTCSALEHYHSMCYRASVLPSLLSKTIPFNRQLTFLRLSSYYTREPRALIAKFSEPTRARIFPSELFTTSLRGAPAEYSKRRRPEEKTKL